jgi:hypothetical protein
MRATLDERARTWAMDVAAMEACAECAMFSYDSVNTLSTEMRGRTIPAETRGGFILPCGEHQAPTKPWAWLADTKIPDEELERLHKEYAFPLSPLKVYLPDGHPDKPVVEAEAAPGVMSRVRSFLGV